MVYTSHAFSSAALELLKVPYLIACGGDRLIPNDFDYC